MRIEDTFNIRRLPEDVFAFMADPAKLARWQTVKTSVTPLDVGPPRLGYRVRERTKVGPRQWDQVVEFTEFEPGRVLGVHVVEGPPSHGRWTMEPAGDDGTRVHFDGEFEGPRLLAPLMERVIARQFRGYHEHLRHQLERGGW
jgi:carbon monoxide dehydrogenase subunit G